MLGRDVISLIFKLRFYNLRIHGQVFFAILLLSLLTIFHFNPIVHGKSADAYLFITPPIHIAKEIGEIFDVAVNISNVENLVCLQFTITYNTSLLDAAQVTQGPFFPPPPNSCFELEKNEPLGFVKVNITLAPSETPRSGNGTLAWISFKVVQGPESCVSSPLDLQETLLFSSALIPIAHDSVGGVYFWKSVLPDPPVEGRSIDLYTQRGGEGFDEPDGEFMVSETVYLFSQVKYQDVPVQQKLVSFEVRNPLNESVVIRTFITDANGLAAISFMIPYLPSSIGVWTAVSVVEIAEKTTWDTLSFRVYPVPVGGYSISLEQHTIEKPLTLYIAIVAILTMASTVIKRKIVQKNKTSMKRRNWIKPANSY